MNMLIGNCATTTLLLFSMIGLEVLHRERRGQVKRIVMEHFNSLTINLSILKKLHRINQEPLP